MTVYNTTIVDSAGQNPVLGDHMTVVRTVTGLTTSQVISKAWLTVKSDVSLADNAAELQIDTADAHGTITDDGTGDTEGEVTFQVSGTDYDSLAAATTYYYDIQVLLDDGTIATIESGTVTWSAEVTKATS